MAEFNKAIDVVLLNEGGYVNNPADPGGETRYGISKRAYPKVDIKNLSLNDARDIYRKDYWSYDGFVDQSVATKMLDMTVNLGKKQAVLILQRALNSRWGCKIRVDGVLGGETLKQANEAHEEDLMNELRAQSVLFYFTLAAAPEHKQFLLGWIRRACQ